MVICIVPSCNESNRKRKNHKNDENEEQRCSFHALPKDKELRRKWICAIFKCDITDISDVESLVEEKNDPRICSKHFKATDFSVSCNVKRLLPGSIPFVPKENSENLIFQSNPNKKIKTKDVTVSPIRQSLSPITNTVLNKARHNFTNVLCSLAGVKKVLFDYPSLENEPENQSQNVYPTSHNLKTNRKKLFDSDLPTEPFVASRNISPIEEFDTEHVSESPTSIEKETGSLVPINSSQDFSSLIEETSNIPEPLLANTSRIPRVLNYEDKSTQATPCVRRRTSKFSYVTTRKLGRDNYKLRKKIQSLQTKITSQQATLKEYQRQAKRKEIVQINKIIDACATSDAKANFIIEQIMAFGKKNPPYLETTLKLCCLIFKKSPSAYCFIRELEILHLPHRITLKRYLGGASGEDGVTSLVKPRLLAESAKLTSDHERLCSLIPDEMAIKARLEYDKKMDRFFGDTTLSSREANHTIGEKLATHLLCFVLQGLSTNIRLPVAYFFTSKLDSEQLHKMMLEVIVAVEECGFIVKRITCDNAKTNTGAFKKLGIGTLSHQVPHPLDSSRILYLSFDQSHLIKNLRNQFLGRYFIYIGLRIDSAFVVKLYDMQKHSLIKPVRNLTRRVLFPSNFDKMNVFRAVMVFSSPVTAALRTIHRLNMCDAEEKENLECTIYFMEMIRTWWEIHDICNCTHGYYRRNENKVPFYDMNDARLEWLEEEFLPFLDVIQSNATLKEEQFTAETFEAINITTKSTVALIKDLLTNGYHFVLTRKLSSDAVEEAFSHLRGSSGYNDTLDVRSCTLNIEHTLKLGIMKASGTSNANGGNKPQVVELLDNNCKTIKPKKRLPLTEPEKPKASFDVALTPYLNGLLQGMEKLTLHDNCHTTITNCSIAQVGGYIVRVAEERSNCPLCLEKLSVPQSKAPIHFLIAEQDNGALKYPSRFLISLLSLVHDFVRVSLDLFPRSNVLATYVNVILPYFSKPLACECGNTALPKVMLEKFLRPMLSNHAMAATDRNEIRKKMNTKPLSRKVLKV